ncbi:hypothetical protein OOU_Y34scaffold00712g2 [Pyricularia oryzae Y34]|uniref:Tyrosinase copper-binding domain-containing protein n=1 Tax=Pyricularia oryzae (strain Y34) TaxID=1143189 RepID=A0AA97PI06_PYRO3|nr:hypothetical protein OOU_Y34scaffold00712g2 [Pyricularia oryzae Y34]
MRPFSCLAAFAALASTAAAIPTAQSAAPNGLEDAKRNFEKNVSGITRGKMAKLKGAAKKERQGKGDHRNSAISTCTAANVAIDLTKEERLDYVNAVKCLMKLPAKTPQEVAPGAKSRVGTAWHRWFVFNYERALGEECAYKGYQPYWGWAKHATAPEKFANLQWAIRTASAATAPPSRTTDPSSHRRPGSKPRPSSYPRVWEAGPSPRPWWNEPPSPPTSLDDVLDLGYVGPSITIRQAMDTTKGPLCYFYQ